MRVVKVDATVDSGAEAVVAPRERVLVGVTPLTESGHEVTLGRQGGEILHVASGRRIALQRRGGVYILSMFFLVPNGEPSASAAQGFARQGV